MPTGSGEPAAGGARDRRPIAFAATDLILAAVYAIVLLVVAPSRHVGGQLITAGLVAAPVAMAAGTLWRRPAGWRVAALACAALLALAAAVVVLLAISAGFLAGVYGDFGRGAAALSAVVMALVVELVGIVPALQLRYLLSSSGRRRFGVAGR